MRSSSRIIVTLLLLVIEAGVALYVAFIMWLSAVWMVDDSVAFRMAPTDWYLAALQRGVVSVVCAVVLTLILYFGNRWWLARTIPSRPQFAVQIALVFGGAVALAGIVGSVQFAVQKPFF